MGAVGGWTGRGHPASGCGQGGEEVPGLRPGTCGETRQGASSRSDATRVGSCSPSRPDFTVFLFLPLSLPSRLSNINKLIYKTRKIILAAEWPFLGPSDHSACSPTAPSLLPRPLPAGVPGPHSFPPGLGLFLRLVHSGARAAALRPLLVSRTWPVQTREEKPSDLPRCSRGPPLPPLPGLRALGHRGLCALAKGTWDCSSCLGTEGPVSPSFPSRFRV